MHRIPTVARAIVLVVALLAGVACAGDHSAVVAPVGTPSSLGLPRLGGSSSQQLLQCDAPSAAQSVTSVIGTLGGTLQIGNTRVVIPQDAVLAPTTFTLTVPASRLVEISVRAGDAEHYVFQQPVLVSIDYGRCAASLSPFRSVSAWHIDETSKALLEDMGGLDLRPLNTVTFATGHLSGYAVAD